MCVAQLRGVKFLSDDPVNIQPKEGTNRRKALDALHDVALFFDYADDKYDDADTAYLADLNAERTSHIEDILNQE